MGKGQQKFSVCGLSEKIFFYAYRIKLILKRIKLKWAIRLGENE